MTRHALIKSLRAANPFASEPMSDEELFSSIVATPGDPRLGSSPAKRSSYPRKRWLIVPAVLILVTGVGITGTQHFQGEKDTSHIQTVGDPLTLFQTNHWFSPGSRSYSKIFDQDAIPSSVRMAAVVTVPHLGRVEFWYADARQGGWCGGLRLPDGTWEENAVPLCHPTDEQVNNESPAQPVYDVTGFAYEIDTLAPLPWPDHKPVWDENGHWLRPEWDVNYGIVPGAVSGGNPAVKVVDLTTGLSALVGDGGTFALVLPTTVPHLVAYDATGNVVADTGVPGKPGRFSSDPAR
jgi:hypothetical protein